MDDLRLSAALCDAALLRERLGLHADSAHLCHWLLGVLDRWTRDLGLEEAKEHPELVNLYLEVREAEGRGVDGPL